MRKTVTKKATRTRNIGSGLRELSRAQRDDLFCVLKDRFEKNNSRHKGLAWPQIEAKLLANPQKLWSLREMERTGGEPDVIGYDKATGEFIFCDCSAQSPASRRNL